MATLLQRLCLLALIFSVTGSMSLANSLNPAGFTVAGMRLEMTPQQILAVLKQRHDKVTNIEKVGCLKDTVAGIRSAKDPRQPTVDPHCTGVIDSETAHIAFIEDYPAHPGVMRAYSIHFRLKGDPETLLRALKSHYGEPSWSYNYGGMMAWCGPKPVPKLIMPALNPCASNEPMAEPHLDGSLGDAGTVNNAIGSVGLSLGADLHLYDWGFASARNQALIQAQNAAIQAATKINF